MSKVQDLLIFSIVICAGLVVGFMTVTLFIQPENKIGNIPLHSETQNQVEDSAASAVAAKSSNNKPATKPEQARIETGAAPANLQRAWQLAESDCPAALVETRRVLSLRNAEPSLFLDASKLSYKCKAWSETLRFSQRVLQGQSTDEEKARAYDWMAYASFREKNFDQAIRQKQKQIELERDTATPRNLSRAYGWLGRYFRENGDLANAEKSVRAALKLAREAKSDQLVQNHLLSLASVLFKSGDRTGACTNWKKITTQAARVKTLISENCTG